MSARDATAPPLSRRRFLAASAAASGSALLWAPPAMATRHRGAAHILTARTGTAALRGANKPATAIWGFEGTAPGPVLRLRQGDRLNATLVNRLPQPSSIHWHGIRVPNDMDGVPGVTQDATMPNEVFPYSFVCADAGTYWYHPHGNSSEQLGRGLWGVLVVEETRPPEADRELIWVIGDWKLNDDGTINSDFANEQERTHEGRIGNTITVNGAPGGEIPLRRNERLRIRLLNVANARIFELGFEGHDPWLIALDGQPVPPRKLGAEKLVLGPGMRADLLLDADRADGERQPLLHYPPGEDPEALLRFTYLDQSPVRPQPLPPPAALAANPIGVPNLARAERHSVVFSGGATPGNMPGMRKPGETPPPQTGDHPHGSWTVNGKALIHDGHAHSHARIAPLLTLRRNASVIFALKNDSVFDHPIHLHGHTFRIVSRNGKPLAVPICTDTILMTQQEEAEIAFVADNPGDWMIHCHILEHQAAGMGAIFRVSA
jgi:FtsP/CotA-like multicopper oxidase with cupredoxin domain